MALPRTASSRRPSSSRRCRWHRAILSSRFARGQFAQPMRHLPAQQGAPANSFRLAVCDVDPCKGGIAQKPYATFSVAPAQSAAVDELWQRAIEGAGNSMPQPWTELSKDIARSMQGTKHKGDPQDN